MGCDSMNDQAKQEAKDAVAKLQSLASENGETLEALIEYAQGGDSMEEEKSEGMDSPKIALLAARMKSKAMPMESDEA